jgi:hypothetical protein
MRMGESAIKNHEVGSDFKTSLCLRWVIHCCKRENRVNIACGLFCGQIHQRMLKFIPSAIGKPVMKSKCLLKQLSTRLFE